MPNHNPGVGNDAVKVLKVTSFSSIPQTSSDQHQLFFNVKDVKCKKSDSFYFSVYMHVKNYNKLPIGKYSRQYLNPYVQRLKKEGLIMKVGYGVWQVLKEWKDVKKDGKVSNIRGHGFHYKIRLPKIINWEKRKVFFDKVGIKYKDMQKYQSIDWNGFKVWFCDRVLVIYTDKSYYGKIAEEGYNYALFDLEQLLQSIESKLSITLRINKLYHFKVCKQHYGKIKDVLARQCNKEGVKIRCYYNGEGWLVIDNSLNLNELETDNPETSMKDMDKVVIPFFNDLKEHYVRTGESIRISELIRLSSIMVEDRKFYAENMNSHVKAVQELAKGVHELRNKISKINTAHLNQYQTRLNGW